MKNSRGFTLIELLVVIAIIGILSSVVLASLNSARSKGNDAALRSNLANIRTQAAVFVDNGSSMTTNSANGVCDGAFFTDSVISKQIAAAKSAGSGTAFCNSNSVTGAWVVQAQSKTTTLYACVDSTGVAATSSTALSGAAIVCN